MTSENGGGEDDDTDDSPEYGIQHDKPVLACDTFGCGQKPVDESGRCRVCREAYKNGFCEGYQERKDDKDGGVRGRREIQVIVTDLDVLIEEAEGDAHPMLVERLVGISEDLKEVLGEDGDL